MDRGEYDRLISTLGKRVFLLHSVHEKQARLMQTRWAMNYLAGPMTRSQIPSLNQLVGARLDSAAVQTAAASPQPAVASAPPAVAGGAVVEPKTEPIRKQPAAASGSGLPGTETRPMLPSGVKEYFLPNNLTFTQAFKAAGRPYPQEAYSQGLVYRPVLLAQAHIRFLDRKYNLDYEKNTTCLVPSADRRGVVRWENYPGTSVDAGQMDRISRPAGALCPA